MVMKTGLHEAALLVPSAKALSCRWWCSRHHTHSSFTLCNHDCVYCLDSGVVSYSAPHPLEKSLVCPPLSGISPVLNFKANQYLHMHRSTLSPNTTPDNGNLLLNLFNIQSHRESEGHTQALHHCWPLLPRNDTLSGFRRGSQKHTSLSRSSEDQCCWWVLWITPC